jgi:hypothetical protein
MNTLLHIEQKKVPLRSLIVELVNSPFIAEAWHSQHLEMHMSHVLHRAFLVSDFGLSHLRHLLAVDSSAIFFSMDWTSVDNAAEEGIAATAAAAAAVVRLTVGAPFELPLRDSLGFLQVSSESVTPCAAMQCCL